jgi:glycerol kinase
LHCLQQGIALCAPAPVFHLQQHDTSLQGAALLAAGMTGSSHRQAMEIYTHQDGKLLRAKFQRWKVWLDGLL